MLLEKTSYRGKNFEMPTLSSEGVHIVPQPDVPVPAIPLESPIIKDLNTMWDLSKFLTPRVPVSVGRLNPEELSRFSQWGVPRVLDLPIKFPGSDFRLPQELAQFKEVVQKVVNYERAVNPQCYDEYYCYLTVDQRVVTEGQLQREAPCHVDGFQGARWNPKVRINHTYTVGDVLPTIYYPQPFDFSQLDEAKHDFFWEMNRQVALNNSRYTWHSEPGEITLMDAYSVHRGTQASETTPRTWVRLSFEVRQFDRLGNAHNPMFLYNWEMVRRDIEALNLVAFDPDSDRSLQVFPWQDLEGKRLTEGSHKTQPNLKPGTGLEFTPEEIRERYAMLKTISVDSLQAQVKETLHEIVSRAQPTPSELIEALSKLPSAQFLFQQDSRIIEGYSIEEHTSRFLAQVNRYLSNVTVPLPIPMSSVLIGGLLHDLGKSLPDEKNDQHAYTLQVIEDLKEALPVSAQDLRIIRSVIGNDRLGGLIVSQLEKRASIDARKAIAELAQERDLTFDELKDFAELVKVKDPDDSTVAAAREIAKDIKLRAKALDITPIELFNLQKLFYLADTSSYTYDSMDLNDKRAKPGLEFLFELSDQFSAKHGTGLLIREDGQGMIKTSRNVERLLELVEHAVLL